MLKHVDVKKNFLRKFVPLVKPEHVFAREKDIAVGQAVAETRAEVLGGPEFGRPILRPALEQPGFGRFAVAVLAAPLGPVVRARLVGGQ